MRSGLRHMTPGLRTVGLSVLLALVGFASSLPGARAEMLAVTVLDARTGAPIAGAFVQVGPSPGIPFAGNGWVTDGAGEVTFSSPALVGPQTVTAAASGHARASVIDAAAGAVTLRLRPSFAPAELLDPAELSGTVTNVATTSNDGNLDVAIVLPAIRLRDVLTQGSTLIDVPPDTVDFPLVGPTVLPANLVVPTQTEALFFTFSKPTYHFWIEDQATYDFVALAGRVPLSALQSGDPNLLNLVTFREVGAERSIAVNGDAVMNVNSDLNLTQNLTVAVPGAPNGSEIQVLSVADLPQAGGPATLLYDTKAALADVQDSFLLSGRNPGGDLSDAAAYVVGVYQDSSTAAAYQAGRIDRTPITLPASRTLEDYFPLPDLSQSERTFAWSDVEIPGVTSTPTWAFATFELGPILPGDSSVLVEALWEVVAPAASLSFDLPTLPEGAPGGLPDPDGTGAADQLLWDQLLGDPPGDLNEVLVDPFSQLTTFSRRTISVVPLPPISEVITSQHLQALSVGIFPSPGPGPWSVRWDVPDGDASGGATWTIFDVAGRRVAGGEVPGAGHQFAIPADFSPGAGAFWCRIRTSRGAGTARFVVCR